MTCLHSCLFINTSTTRPEIEAVYSVMWFYYEHYWFDINTDAMISPLRLLSTDTQTIVLWAKSSPLYSLNI